MHAFFLLINECLDEYKEQILPPRAKRFANYAIKTGIEGVVQAVIFI
jgi:hypothetical protein